MSSGRQTAEIIDDPIRSRSLGHRLVSVLVVAVVACGAVMFANANAGQIERLVAGVGSVDPWVAALGIACSALAIANRGLLNWSAHRAVGLDAGVGAMTQTAAVGFAAQKMVKPAGVVGLAVFVRHGRRRGHAAGTVTAACLLTATASLAALGVLLTAAIVVLAATGQLTGWWIAAAIGFTGYVLGVAATAIVVLRSRRAAERVWSVGQHLRAWWGRRRGRQVVMAPLPAELFDAVAEARRRPTALRRLLVHAVLSKVLGATALGAAVAAAGLPVTAAGALVIYATALAASLVTVVPGGFGTVEASTAALLVGSGATVGAAAMAVALFRLFDVWVPVLTGAAVARRDRRRVRAEQSAARPYALDMVRMERWARSPGM